MAAAQHVRCSTWALSLDRNMYWSLYYPHRNREPDRSCADHIHVRPTAAYKRAHGGVDDGLSTCLLVKCTSYPPGSGTATPTVSYCRVILVTGLVLTTRKRIAFCLLIAVAFAALWMIYFP